METKKCSKCGEEKELNEFGNNKRKPDGLHVYCKACMRAQHHVWREKRKKQPREIPETKTCALCGETKSQVEFTRDYSRQDGLKGYCRECQNKAVRAHKAGNRLGTLFINKRHECAVKGVAFDLTVEYLESIWTGKCAISGNPIDFGKSKRCVTGAAQLDKVVPELGYVRGNVQFVDGRLNKIKADATIAELEMIIEYMKKNGAK